MLSVLSDINVSLACPANSKVRGPRGPPMLDQQCAMMSHGPGGGENAHISLAQAHTRYRSRCNLNSTT